MNLDMSVPSDSCPDGLHLWTRNEAPFRTCGKPPNTAGCVSAFVPVNSIEFTRVYGRIIGYHDKTPDGFRAYFEDQTLTIDGSYADGVLLSYDSSPRKHIWSFVGALDEPGTQGGSYSCPCIRPDRQYDGLVPPFIGQDYFCDTASRNPFNSVPFAFFSDDPLWDGEGCEGVNECCDFNKPPWFCQELSQSTTERIEMRLCSQYDHTNENIQIEKVELFVQ